MGRQLILAAALAILWLLLSGYFDKPLLLIFGALSILLCVYLAARSGVLDEEGVPSGLMPGIFAYWVWLTGEIGKANIMVAREALAVKPRLSPKVVQVPIAAKTNAGIATFANSITLTPGTVSVNLEDDHILVHALTEELADPSGMAEMGRHIASFEKKRDA
ncbi:MAG: Na+/H+ antiporter subunit E [Pseudomonadota bacterium]